MSKLIVCSLFCLLFFACEDVNTSSEGASTPKQTDETKTPDSASKAEASTSQKSIDESAEQAGKALDFESFNTKIKAAHTNKEEWVNSPLSITLKFTGADMDSNIKSVRSKKLGPGESIQDVIVTVEEEGLMDDSVQGTITFVRMKKEGAVWQLYKAKQAWRCWKGRGHETYSAKPCG